MNDVFLVGNTLRIVAEFRDSAGALVTMDSVEFKWKRPNGAIGTAQGTLESVGKYYANVEADTSGNWSYRVTATLAGYKSADERGFVVRRSTFT